LPAGRPDRIGTSLDRLAFGLLVAVVIARLMMLETLRNALAVSPGAPPVPAGPGPTAGLVLDLLAGLPALLVLARRWIGGGGGATALRLSWSMLPMALLGGWAVLSTVWATDKFAALVSSVHLFAAFVGLWAAVQLVRTWVRLRLLAGVCFGLLLVLITHSLYFLAMERPALQQEWRQHGDEILRQRGIQPGSFEALQFTNKVLRGELMGFSASPNTYAALVVVTMVVSLGALLDRWSRTRRPDGRRSTGATIAAGLVAALVIVLPAVWMIYLAQSRQAFATSVLALAALAAIGLMRGWMARRWRLLYVTGAATVVLAAAAVAGYGIRHGTLFQDSLNFRWRYWVGAVRLVRLHPLAGVGWENFGPHYLGVRLPTATEEIRDPHNFVLRFLAELGIVGGVLVVAWMLRLWWELTRPVLALPAADPDSPDLAQHETRQREPGTDAHRVLDYAARPPRTAGGPPKTGEGPPKTGEGPLRVTGGAAAPLAIAAAAMLINTLAGLDFTQESAWVITELFRQAVFLIVFVVGMSAVTLRFRPSAELDDRPAPWVLWAILVALGVFLIHNTIDFSLFEVGPLFFFMLLAGAALGMRLPLPLPPPREVGPPRDRRPVAIALAVGGVLWLTVAGALLLPVATAEASAADGDELIRKARVPDGAAALEAAFRRLPIDADYAFRAAQSWRLMAQADRGRGMAQAADGDVARARDLYAAAIAADPVAPRYLAAQAELEMEQPGGAGGDLARARPAYEAAVRLDPNNLSDRVRYGELLERLNQRESAADAYERALWYNDQLTREEKKRLPPATVDNLRARINRLRLTRS
jgi:O-antigen ligase